MSTIIIPIWNDSSGLATGPLNYPAARDNVHAERLIARGFEDARRARGTDARVVVMDDVTWTPLKTFRDGDEIDMSMTGKEALAGFRMVNAVRTVAEAAGAKSIDVVKFIEGLEAAGMEIVAKEMSPETVVASSDLDHG